MIPFHSSFFFRRDSTWGHPEAFIGHDEGHMLSYTNPFQLLAFGSLAYPQGNSVTALNLPAELSYDLSGM